ncbi:MAG: SDR family NAD(P)-dependent oxidoreductase, partial [Chloroflexota bacterium]|nr:SDR family NAD(P)-dependent oxidoreductase [Chloroflexota bacterium]
MRLEGKVALISGGSRGMGAFEAELFVKEGAKVVVGDVREEEGRALVDKIGGDSVFVRLDVTSESDWAAAVNEAVGRYGKLDILV